MNLKEFEEQKTRGNPDLSPDGKCVIQDKGFYLCEGMTRFLNGSIVNEKGRTNYLYLATNLETFEEKYRGVVAYIPNSRGLMLSYCPFCGNEILNYPKEESEVA